MLTTAQPLVPSATKQLSLQKQYRIYSECTEEDTVTMLEEIREDEVEEVMDFVFEGDGIDQVVGCGDYEDEIDLSDNEY